MDRWTLTNVCIFSIVVPVVPFIKDVVLDDSFGTLPAFGSLQVYRCVADHSTIRNEASERERLGSVFYVGV